MVKSASPMIAKSSDGPLISEEERARRVEAVNYARGSSALSGVTLTPKLEELNRQYIDGLITSAEHSEAIRQIYRLH
jgi:hypothetical protein